MPHLCFYCFLDNEKYKILKITCQAFYNVVEKSLKQPDNTG